MSVISDFAAKMDQHNAKMDAAVDGLTADMKDLNDKIAQLQSTSGQITPEDQALLDAIEAKASAVADKVAALDSMNPPAVPSDTGGAPQIPPV